MNKKVIVQIEGKNLWGQSEKVPKNEIESGQKLGKLIEESLLDFFENSSIKISISWGMTFCHSIGGVYISVLIGKYEIKTFIVKNVFEIFYKGDQLLRIDTPNEYLFFQEKYFPYIAESISFSVKAFLERRKFTFKNAP